MYNSCHSKSFEKLQLQPIAHNINKFEQSERQEGNIVNQERNIKLNFWKTKSITIPMTKHAVIRSSIIW